MALIIRLDIDRPYGRAPFARHLLSRVSSDFYMPRLPGCGYLLELVRMLNMLNRARARAYVFFRRCTLPSNQVRDLLLAGRHEPGLHLENSRSFDTFREEMDIVENHLGAKVLAVSKHGSGGSKYGFHHYAPYEPEKYTDWAENASLRVFLGNLEDPTMVPNITNKGLLVFPSAFWLEPHWRDTNKFTVDWLLKHARSQDVVLLVHPENVLADPDLTSDFERIVHTLESRIVQ